MNFNNIKVNDCFYDENNNRYLTVISVYSDNILCSVEEFDYAIDDFIYVDSLLFTRSELMHFICQN